MGTCYIKRPPSMGVYNSIRGMYSCALCGIDFTNRKSLIKRDTRSVSKETLSVIFIRSNRILGSFFFELVDSLSRYFVSDLSGSSSFIIHPATKCYGSATHVIVECCPPSLEWGDKTLVEHLQPGLFKTVLDSKSVLCK